MNSSQLSVESPGPWSSATSLHEDFQSEDIDMKPVPSFYQPEQTDAPTTPSPLSNMAPLTPLTPAMDELPPHPLGSTHSPVLITLIIYHKIT